MYIHGYTMDILGGYTWYIQGYTMYIPCICRTSTYTWYIPGIFQAYTENRGSRWTLGGFSYLPIIGTDPRVRACATQARPAGLRDPSGALCAGGLGSGRLLADQAELWTRDAILQRIVQTQPFESLGLLPDRERCCNSNKAATVFV